MYICVYLLCIYYVFTMYLLCIYYVFQTPFTTQPAVAAHIPKSRPFSGSQAAVAKRGCRVDRSHESTSIPYKQQQPLDLCVVSGRIVSFTLYIKSCYAQCTLDTITERGTGIS